MSKHTPQLQSDYLAIAMDPIAVAKLLRQAKKFFSKYDFQAFAFRGVSGALMAPVIAHKCNKTLIVVRKPKSDETNHSFMPVEGDCAAARYVIVDDFVSSGRTCNSIVLGVAGFNPAARCIGAFFYNDIMKYPKEYEMKIHPVKKYVDSNLVHICHDASQWEIRNYDDSKNV